MPRVFVENEILLGKNSFTVNLTTAGTLEMTKIGPGDEEKHTCDVCQKTFSQKRYLKDHISVHLDLHRERFPIVIDKETGGPLHQCTKCDFNNPKNYKVCRHFKSKHCQTKPQSKPDDNTHPCQHCKFIAKRKDNLIRHQRKHNKSLNLSVNTGSEKSKVFFCNYNNYELLFFYFVGTSC